MLGLIAGASVALQLNQGYLELSLSRSAVLIGSALWLIVAYVLSRRRHLAIASCMIVGLVIAALALATYLFPDLALLLAPFAALPVALAALLLSRRVVYITALLTILALGGTQYLPRYPLPEALRPTLPGALGPEMIAPLYGLALALTFLALILAPMRAELIRLLGQLRSAEQASAQAEQALRAAERERQAALGALDCWQRRQATVLQQIGDGVIGVGPGGQIVRANAAAERFWSEAHGGDLVGQPIEHVRATAASPAANPPAALIELPADAAPEADGEWYTHILVDRREHARLARLRDDLLGLLAEEMRNPLTSMVTALEMTLGQNLPEGADRVLVGAKRSGQRLLDLITTMIDISQIEHDPGALRQAPASLRSVLEAGLAQTAPLQHQSAVTVVVEYSGDGVIALDSERMRQACIHLLEQALRHSPPYSTVQVRTEHQNGTLTVRISDQGPGLTPEQRAAIFEQRALSEGRSPATLGLAFSKLVIEKHGGRLWVESSGGQGSSYVFTLPAAKPN